jgi:hypothetical protein
LKDKKVESGEKQAEKRKIEGEISEPVLGK